ncbi:MAG: Asp-tRNA(Asn)/Glu-tRNA(Gln) amidotransferase GatCAB subunit A [Deltaproteobacteria bacterium]|nr:Asp-tRNA(Asn)/Glu-tRNA(Gln) amidotransferase GatCAB subunit A [Deltaproteobacteria bacterium]
MKALDLEELTIAKLAPRIKKKEISPLRLTELYLQRIEKLNPRLNAYLTALEKEALAQAAELDTEIQRGRYRGVLHGIPFSIKDNLAMKGVRTTAGTKVLSEWVPDFDATVVSRLREAGAIILGKTNMHEWAKGSSGINEFYGPVHNPWNTDHATGGSSGGAAAALAASLCMASIGTDSAGSVRSPAALCGTVGLKPTLRRVSVFGGVPGTGGYSTNHFGIFTKTVEDAALVLRQIAGHDPKDSLSSTEPVPNYSRAIGKSVNGMKAGVLRGYFEENMASEVKRAFTEAVKTLESLGMKSEEITIPHMDLIPAVQGCTSRAESSSDHEPFLRTKPRDYSPSMLRTQIAALLVPAGTYVTAQRVRRLICDEFDEALRRVDVLVAPSVPIPAHTLEESKRGIAEVDGRNLTLQFFKGNLLTQCTILFNVTGLPAVSVCCGFSSKGLPIGLQIAGSSFGEEDILQVAHAYEQEAGWYRRRPELGEQ